MKRCPTCQRTFDDNMKFCQADGTPLVSDTAGAGGSQAPDFDPMKTVLGTPPPVDLPPPSPFGSSEPPRNPSAGLNPPSFGDLGGSTPLNQPSGGFSDAPRSTPSFKEPEPQFGQNYGQQQPFGNAPSDWTPPPAPTNWGNQGLGQNTPFSPPPPMTGAGGQNKTLAIVSLVCGILSCLCCLSIITGPAALITGFMANGNITKNPSVYTGKSMATAGMITGGIGTLLGILGVILQLSGALANLGR